MRYLRTTSNRRLLATLAGLVIAAGGGTAIAVAASGSGATPRPQPLAQAIHQALGAAPVPGITAHITFSNHLIDASDFQGSNPILSGASGRLWLSPATHQLRLELQSTSGQDAQLVVNQRSVWLYEPSGNTVYQGTLPPERRDAVHHREVPSVGQIQSKLTELMQHLTVSGAQPDNVAGQPAYTVTVSPKHDGGLLGSAALAWDALRGIPLRVAVYARDSATPVLELRADDISFGSVDRSVFDISPPGSAKVVRVAAPAGAHGELRAARRRHRLTRGLQAVARQLPFTLSAPRTLVGLPRHTVTLLNWGGHPAALVTYGENLGGVAVIEQPAEAGASARPPASHGDGHDRGFSLPTVSINGATGQELDTALGTMVRFTRRGVAYTVVGSVPPAAADAAARAL